MKEEFVKERVGKVGGQAVIEGIMMRGKSSYTTAVRCPDGSIIRDSHPNEIKKKNAFLRFPVIRGVVNFIDSMRLSFSTLSFAADSLNLEEETAFEKWLTKHMGKSLTALIMGIGAALGVVLGAVLFMILPARLSGLIKNAVLKRVFEGVIKIAIFIAYISLVSLMSDIKRTFMYHGAEHKTVFCYEKGLELTVENVRPQKRFHPRCGTSFMFLMILVGICVGVLIGLVVPAAVESTALYIAIKILLLPLIVGLGYEIIRYAGKHDNFLIRLVTAPGLWIQRITTKEPSDDMIEVAIVALKSALPEEYSEDEVFTGIKLPEKGGAPQENADREKSESAAENAEEIPAFSAEKQEEAK